MADGLCRLGLGNLDLLVPHSLGLADRSTLVFLGDADLGVIDRLGGRLLAQSIDVAGLVLDVRDIAVDELEPELLQLPFDAHRDSADQLFPVGIDLLDGHRGDDDAHLPGDDLLRELADVDIRLAQQPVRCGHHQLRLLGYCDGEVRRDADADFLGREGVLQLNLDIERPERHEPVTLENGGDEFRTAVDALGTLSFPGLAEHDKDLIGWAHFEAAQGGREDNDEEEYPNANEDGIDAHGFFDSTRRFGPSSLMTVTVLPVEIGRVSLVTAASVSSPVFRVTWTSPPFAGSIVV